MGRPRVPQLTPTLLTALLAGALALPGCARWMGAGNDPRPPDAAAPESDATADGSGLDGAAPDGDTTCTQAPADLPLGDLPTDAWQAVHLGACSQGAHLGVGAGGQTLRLRLQGATAPLHVEVHNDHDEPVASASLPSGATTLELPISVDESGGLRVTVRPEDPSLPMDYAVRLDCDAGCDLETTRYPVVLVHGAGGPAVFGTLDYFYGVLDELEGRGYRVSAPLVTGWAHSTQRAQELASAIDAVLAETGADRVHLIGHSQAGLDFRVLTSPLGLDAGHRVATATSISTPHTGLHPSYASMSQYFGMDVTEAYLSGEFAQLYPDLPGLPRFSWAAATCGAYETTCLDTYDDEVVASQLASSYLSLRSLYGADGTGGDNDGVVPVSTAAWGTFLGTLAADHWDVVGQVPLQRISTFDTPAFYLAEVRRLRALEIDLAL